MISPTNGKTFKEIMTSDGFYYGAEVVTSRGYAPAESPEGLADLAEQLLADERIAWVSITDNPGGNPMLPPDWLGRLLPGQKGRLVLHLTCKDMNRSTLESSAWKYASEGFRHILVMTGDYPIAGYRGIASPVFDIESTALIAMLDAMNKGLEVPGRRGKTDVLRKTDFFIGCAVSSFKRHEGEQMPQYFKLLQKIANGAQFIIPQLGYDMRKFYEIKLFLTSHEIDIPVVGNVYLLNKFVAGMFNRGDIPGCVVSDELLELIKKYAAGEDKGRSFFRELAAKQLAVFKGLGFQAGYLGGIQKSEIFLEIIEKAESYGENDWKEFAKELQFPVKDEFYLFEQDPETGLGDPNRINRQYLETLKNPPKSKQVNFNYRLSRLVHSKFFVPDQGFFNLMKRIYARWDKKPSLISKTVRGVEELSKFIMYNCQDCGDCGLPDCAYLCPNTACSKSMRNGPCGGSDDGICEVDAKECIWVRAYERLKCYHESEQMFDRPAIYYNAKLKDTSAWANTYLGRDHFAFGTESTE